MANSFPFDSDHIDDDDLAALRELRSLAPTDRSAHAWEAPPSDLFARISAAAIDPVDTAPPAAAPTAPRGDGNVASIADRRNAKRPRNIGWLVAAAAVLAVIAGAILINSRPIESVVSEVALDRLGDRGEGTATLVDVDGSMQLRVDTTDLDPGDGYLEVWVIDPTVSKLVSLGPVRDDGRYNIPASVDMAEFPIVDVSVEPTDGDPTHSGDSVLRGQLEL